MVTRIPLVFVLTSLLVREASYNSITLIATGQVRTTHLLKYIYNSCRTILTAAVLISVEQNPSSFEDFNQTSDGTELPLAVSWFSTEGAGSVCIPVDIESLGISGIGDGSNVTLQTMLTGGDGNLFQVNNLWIYMSLFSLLTCLSVCRSHTAKGLQCALKYILYKDSERNS